MAKKLIKMRRFSTDDEKYIVFDYFSQRGFFIEYSLGLMFM